MDDKRKGELSRAFVVIVYARVNSAPLPGPFLYKNKSNIPCHILLICPNNANFVGQVKFC